MTLITRIAASARTLKIQTKKIWALSLPYFQSSEKWRARGLLAAIVALNLGTVYMLVLLNDWNRTFYDALQNKDQPVFWSQLGVFCWIAAGIIAVSVYKFYLTQLLEMRWRRWMTSEYLRRWLSGHAFYQLELAQFTPSGHHSNAPDQPVPKPADNPDQRIQEDVNQFTSYTVSLSMGLLNAVVTLVSFIGILWTLSGSFGFSFDGQHYTVPGFMVWMALLYCVLGSAVTHFIGRPLVALNFQQQRLEADFRHHMVRVREYSESIALDKGGPVEQNLLEARFGRVLTNYWQLLRTQKNLLWFTTSFGQVATVFPMVVAAPRFFSGAIQLGDLMQVASAFNRVQDSLSWLVDNYDRLATWSATADRLASFEASFAMLQAPSTADTMHQSSGTGESEGLSAINLDLQLANGTTLFRAAHLALHPGDHVLLSGPSGSGKSTLFRTLAGIWPWASGTLHRPADFAGTAMFLPQRPYLPQGRLRDALAYPEPVSHYSDDALQQALRDALLPDLVGRLDEEAAWNLRLSGGEQQRLAIARVLLKKPHWLFADEATSALDEAAEATLYQRLLATVAQSNGAIVSIAHRASVKAFHERSWTVGTKEGAGLQRQLVED